MITEESIYRVIDVLLDHTPAPRASSAADWNALVVAAREANLLGSLGEKLHESGEHSGCAADRHLEGARQLSERQRRSVRWEARCIDDALERLNVPVVALKGAAYVLGDYPNAGGRLFGDIDILVPARALGAVEIALMVAGWTPVDSKTEYDQRYYRTWMHELPPMVHPRRGSVIDVHHTILPPTARLKPSPQSIIDRSRAVPGYRSLRVPCPEDLIIHSITHLVHEGELGNGLRDLYDIHRLVVGQHEQAGFWGRLLADTSGHGLERAVGLGLALVRRYYRTPIPEAAITALRLDQREREARALLTLYELALIPKGLRTRPRAAGFADLALYLRAHWLRMPPGLLTKHLSRKIWFRLTETSTRDTERSP